MNIGSTNDLVDKTCWLVRATIVLTTIVLMAGCAGWFAEPDPNLGSEDAVIATEIKTALIQEQDLNAAPIKVEVTQGIVRLTGFAETEARKQLATVIAESISGVSRVINKIIVK